MILTLTPAPNLQKTIGLQSVRQRLVFAQHRLHDRHVPFQLSALSYLRLVYSAMQTYQRLGLIETTTIPNRTPYLSLLNQLIQQDLEWWKRCYVSKSGDLVSDDRSIQTFLYPLNTFVENILMAS